VRLLAAAGVSSLLLSAALSEVTFTDVTRQTGVDYLNLSGEPGKRYILSSLGSGAALFDYDEDGDLDLYLVNGASLGEGGSISSAPGRFYRNEGDWRFTDVTRSAAVAYGDWGMGCAAGDFDNDGLVDLFLTGIGAHALYRNRGDGTFVEMTDPAKVRDRGWGTSAAFFDADGDSDLDLYVAHYLEADLGSLLGRASGPPCLWFGLAVFCGPSGLPGARDFFYRNNGDGTFKEASRESGLFDSSAAYGLGVVAGDYDDDGDADLYVANDSMANFLFRNQGRGVFAEVGLLAGVAYNAEGRAQASMGVDLGDANGDGLLDLFVTNFSHDYNTLYLNHGRGGFLDATAEANLRLASWFYLGWATRFADFDLDGDEDLFVVNGHVYPQVDGSDLQTTYRQRNQLLWNDGRGRFELGSSNGEETTRGNASGRGGAFGDLDNDGDFDAVVVNIDDRPSFLRNEATPNRNWIGLRLIGRTSNRDALGARVRLTAGGRRQMKEVHPSGSFLSSNDVRLLFGLGESPAAESLSIRWPSGKVQLLKTPGPGRYLTVVEEQ